MANSEETKTPYGIPKWFDQGGAKTDSNKIFSYVKKKKMTFFATATDRDYVDYLDSKSVPCYKVGSDDLTHHYLISHIAKKKKPIKCLAYRKF